MRALVLLLRCLFSICILFEIAFITGKKSNDAKKSINNYNENTNLESNDVATKISDNIAI